MSNPSVQAIVLAGGFGTRLSPITESIPKPLVKVLDVPVLENVICSIKKTAAKSITVSTHYLPHKIEELCNSIDKSTVCKKEAVPLGTAGGVKNCYDGKSDACLVVSGDAVFDFDLQKAIDYHFENKNEITIITCRKENPTEFGIVICNENGRVIRLDEKPAWKNVKSDVVNTGIYVLSQYALNSIPTGMEYDFSKNLIPKLIKEGKSVGAFCAEGYWCDIGTLNEYYKCNRDASAGVFKLCRQDKEDIKMLRKKGIHADDGVFVAKNVTIGKNVRICQTSIIGKNTIIGDNCDIFASIIGQNVTLGKGTSIAGAIISDGTRIDENCVVNEGCVIADFCTIKEGTLLKKKTMLLPNTVVDAEDKRMAEFSNKECVFVDDGKIRFNLTHSTDEIVRFASAVSLSCKKSERRKTVIAVMTNKETSFANSLFEAGLFLSDTSVYNLGLGNEAVLKYIMMHTSADGYVFINAKNEDCEITVFDENGTHISNEAERKIAKIYNSLTSTKDIFTDTKQQSRTLKIPSLQIYNDAVTAFCESLTGTYGFCSLEICLAKNGNEINSEILKSITEKLGGQVVFGSFKGKICIDCDSMSIKYNDLLIDFNHITAVVYNNLHILGKDGLNLPNHVPFTIRHMAQAKKYESNSSSSLCDNIFYDGIIAILLFLAVMVLTNETPDVLYKEIPRFDIFTDEYLADINRGATMEKISKLYSNGKTSDGEGIHLSLADGEVTVIPNRAKGFKIVTEARSMEAAKELAVKIGDIIKNK